MQYYFTIFKYNWYGGSGIWIHYLHSRIYSKKAKIILYKNMRYLVLEERSKLYIKTWRVICKLLYCDHSTYFVLQLWMFNKFFFTNRTHRFIVYCYEHRIKLNQIKLNFTQFFSENFSTFSFYILKETLAGLKVTIL